MIEDINKKIDLLINKISNLDGGSFDETAVVYILVEAYKIAERKWPDQFKKQIPYIVFFRNWVAHTEINKKSELTSVDVISGNNIKTERLQKEILLLLEIQDSKEKLKTLWTSFEKSLMAVLKDQPVFLNQKIEIQEIENGGGQFSIKIQ